MLLSITIEGINIIKQYEGFSSTSYICPGGKKTIGYGHVIKDDEKFEEPISEFEATQILLEDIKIAEKAVKRHLKISTLNNNQFSALVSFTFNLGEGNFARSTLLKQVNAENKMLAALEFVKWIYVGDKKFLGLLRRRIDEAALFLK